MVRIHVLENDFLSDNCERLLIRISKIMGESDSHARMTRLYIHQCKQLLEIKTYH